MTYNLHPEQDRELYQEQDRKLHQEYIIAHYPDLVGAYRNTYCTVCRYKAVPDQCRYRILPVTTRGELCPYYTYNMEHDLNARPSLPDPKKSANQPTTKPP